MSDALARENARLKAGVERMGAAFIAAQDHDGAAAALVRILDPERMTVGEQNACVLLIRYCRRRVAEERRVVGDVKGE